MRLVVLLLLCHPFHFALVRLKPRACACEDTPGFSADIRHQTGSLIYDATNEWYICCSLSVSPAGLLLLKNILNESKFREILFMEEFSDNPKIEIVSPRLF